MVRLHHLRRDSPTRRLISGKELCEGDRIPILLLPNLDLLPMGVRSFLRIISGGFQSESSQAIRSCSRFHRGAFAGRPPILSSAWRLVSRLACAERLVVSGSSCPSRFWITVRSTPEATK